MNRAELTAAAAQADVVVLLDYPNMDGIITTMVDVYINLKLLGMNPLFVTIMPDDVREGGRLAVRMYRSMPVDGQTLNFTLRRDADGVHTRKLLVSFGAMRRNTSFTMVADELMVILDAGTVLNDRLNRGSRGAAHVYDLAKTTDVRILGNTCHAPFFDGLDYRVYRQKFSMARLEHVQRKFINGDDEFHERERETSRKEGIMRERDLGAKKLVYQRWNNVYPGVYSENIGKAIFEFRWMNRPVHYSPANRTQPDGLTEYLALFGVDDTVEQELTFTKADVDRLLVGLKPDDELIKALIK